MMRLIELRLNSFPSIIFISASIFAYLTNQVAGMPIGVSSTAFLFVPKRQIFVPYFLLCFSFCSNFPPKLLQVFFRFLQASECFFLSEDNSAYVHHAFLWFLLKENKVFLFFPQEYLTQGFHLFSD